MNRPESFRANTRTCAPHLNCVASDFNFMNYRQLWNRRRNDRRTHLL